MPVMGMVQMSINQVVHMIAMRNCLVPTARTMNVITLVAATLVFRSTILRVVTGNLNGVLIHVAIMDMMQMPIMQIVRVITVFNRRMAAIRAVYMLVVSVFVTVCAHSTMINLGFLIVQQNRQQRLVSHRHIHLPLYFCCPQHARVL